MKSITMNLIVATAVLFGSAVLAADETGSMTEETGNMTQPAETETLEAVSAEPIMDEAALPPPDETNRPARNLSKINGYYKQTTASRPRNLDLRHCLELKDNLEIAKCAGE